MEIDQLDTGDDAAIAEAAAVFDAAESEGRPHAIRLTVDTFAHEVRHHDPARCKTFYVARDEGRTVAVGMTMISLLDNVDKGFVAVWVAPGDRGRGFGSQLVAVVERLAREHGCTTLISQANIPFAQRDDHPYLAFASRHGYAVDISNVVRVLDVPVADATLARLEERAAPHHTAYRILTFQDGVPDALFESWCALANQFNLEAPHGDIDWEEERTTPEIVRQQDAERIRSGGHAVRSAAVDAAGVVVAYTHLGLPQDNVAVFQGATLVGPGHRGHRLGLAVKVAALRELQRSFPERTSIHTDNAEVNDHMIAVNEQLGFRGVETRPMFRKRLA